MTETDISDQELAKLCLLCFYSPKDIPSFWKKVIDTPSLVKLHPYRSVCRTDFFSEIGGRAHIFVLDIGDSKICVTVFCPAEGPLYTLFVAGDWELVEMDKVMVTRGIKRMLDSRITKAQSFSAESGFRTLYTDVFPESTATVYEEKVVDVARVIAPSSITFYQAVSDSILEHEKLYKTKRVFTGLSFGGMLSAAFAYKMGGCDRLVAFGSPRVGDKAFVEQVTRTTKSLHWYVNKGDPIPRHPEAAYPFAQTDPRDCDKPSHECNLTCHARYLGIDFVKIDIKTHMSHMVRFFGLKLKTS